MIYLDNSATTQPYDDVLTTYTKVAETYFANPSSLHGLGVQTEKLVQQARKRMADLLHVHADELVFTSGGTEGNNMAIKGTALQHYTRGKHVITTQIEHASSRESFFQLEKLGFDVTYLPVNKDGRLSVEDVKRALRDDTILVSIIHVNNEVGTIQPIEEIGRLLRQYPKLYFHVDHVQGLSKVPLSFHEAGVDLATLSGHKIHGLKGTGALYVARGVTLSPLLTGGQQERQLRAGTENVPGIVSLAKAMRLSMEEMTHRLTHVTELKQMVLDGLTEIEGLTVNTPKQGSAPHVINVSIPGIKPEVLIHALEEHEIYVSTKSACSSREANASYVLTAMGRKESEARSAIRVSLSFHNTKKEVHRFLAIFQSTLAKLRSVMEEEKNDT